MSILVVTEQERGSWRKMSWEVLAAGQQLSANTDEPLRAAVLGADIHRLAEDLASKRLAQVYSLDHDLLRLYTPDAYTHALRGLIEQIKPRLVLFPHTYQVRDFGPKLAASLGRAFISDVLSVEHDGGTFVFVRQLFQGKLHAEVAAEGAPPHFASVQSGAFREDQVAAGDGPAPVERAELTFDAAQIRTKAEEPFREAKGEVDLSSAPVIVAVGRGIKEEQNISIAKELAEALGAEIAASRPICDNGWIPLERQIGSSGQTVSPKLYVALGISGAIQHVVGMKGSKTIVAINKDPGAPIFEIADYGIVGDLFEVAPRLVEAIKESSGG